MFAILVINWFLITCNLLSLCALWSSTFIIVVGNNESQTLPLPHNISYYSLDWVNPSKRGGMDGVFRGLAGRLRGISLGRSLGEIWRSSTASLRKAPSIPTLLLGFSFYLK